VRVYARNYNVLRVMSGMGGLAYSNWCDWYGWSSILYRFVSIIYNTLK
jgi:hypothetical protein